MTVHPTAPGADRGSAGSVIVGVRPNQPDSVVLQAASFAIHFGAQLVCACVDASRYSVEEAPDGTVRSFPLDPDAADQGNDAFPPELQAHLRQLLEPTGVRWSIRSLAGDPGRALAHLADRLDAVLLVVGSRDATMRVGLREFFSGSVAVHLAHRQHRPVVVIPLFPVAPEKPLPWESQ